MIEIAIFDLVPNDLLLGNVYFPQEDNFSINFAMIGYESIYAVPNLGTIFFIFLTFLILIPIGWCLKFFAVDTREVRKPNKKLREFLYWKGIIRFLIESYMELILAVTLNVKLYRSESGYLGVKFSNWFTIFFFIVLILLPIWMAIFFYKK